MKLLCLSNGHGEDAIAVRILQALQRHRAHPKLVALPLVGKGQAYVNAGIPVIGPTQQMPSGGFVYMDGRQLARDLKGGLLPLTLAQLKTVKAWAREGGDILAVGDIVPLLFAWWSGAPYAFVGTAKSEYYLRDEAGWLPRRTWFERMESWSGSVYLPWERWLMSRPRCKAVFPRDTLTADVLKKWPIPAQDLGNPMMDDLAPTQSEVQGAFARVETLDTEQPLAVVLLPGSRSPEAYENWQLIMSAVGGLITAFRRRHLLLLGAIAPGLDLDPLCKTLTALGWLPQVAPDLTFTQRNATLVLTQTAFADCLHRADFAIAMAGTATEQFVGLGKPAITLPGRGPQFTEAFAEAQTRLLGPSTVLVKQPAKAAEVIQAILHDPDRLQIITESGQRRMGSPGAAQRIADCLMQCMTP